MPFAITQITLEQPKEIYSRRPNQNPGYSAQTTPQSIVHFCSIGRIHKVARNDEKSRDGHSCDRLEPHPNSAEFERNMQTDYQSGQQKLQIVDIVISRSNHTLYKGYSVNQTFIPQRYRFHYLHNGWTVIVVLKVRNDSGLRWLPGPVCPDKRKVKLFYQYSQTFFADCFYIMT